MCETNHAYSLLSSKGSIILKITTHCMTKKLRHKHGFCLRYIKEYEMQYYLIHLLKRDNHTHALGNKMENWFRV